MPYLIITRNDLEGTMSKTDTVLWIYEHKNLHCWLLNQPSVQENQFWILLIQFLTRLNKLKERKKKHSRKDCRESTIRLFSLSKNALKKYNPTPEKGGKNYSRSTYPAHAVPICKRLKILNLNNIYRFQLGRLCFCLR